MTCLRSHSASLADLSPGLQTPAFFQCMEKSGRRRRTSPLRTHVGTATDRALLNRACPHTPSNWPLCAPLRRREGKGPPRFPYPPRSRSKTVLGQDHVLDLQSSTPPAGPCCSHVSVSRTPELTEKLPAGSDTVQLGPLLQTFPGYQESPFPTKRMPAPEASQHRNQKHGGKRQGARQQPLSKTKEMWRCRCHLGEPWQ